MDDGLVGMGVEQGADRRDQRRPIAAGQVDAADRALEEHVAGEDRVLAPDRVGDVAGAVSRREDDVELQPGQLQGLAAGHGLVGVVALVGAEPGPGDEGHDVGEDRHLEPRAVDGRPGRRRHRRDGADVVEVAVGEQDRLDLAHRTGGGEDPLRLLAGVDDKHAVVALAPHQEAVLGNRPDREHLDVEAHRRRPA
jgi:hypothetical protein